MHIPPAASQGFESLYLHWTIPAGILVLAFMGCKDRSIGVGQFFSENVEILPSQLDIHFSFLPPFLLELMGIKFTKESN